MIGTQAVIFRSRKISCAAVFDKSGDNPEQWQKQPPCGAAVLFVTHRAVWHEIGGSGSSKISTMGEAFLGRRESVRKGFSRREFSHEKLPLFGSSTRSFTVQKCPHADQRIRPSASSGKTGKIIARKIAIASAKCRTDGARRGKNISGLQSRSPLRRRQWILRGQCVGGQLQGANR